MIDYDEPDEVNGARGLFSIVPEGFMVSRL